VSENEKTQTLEEWARAGGCACKPDGTKCLAHADLTPNEEEGDLCPSCGASPEQICDSDCEQEDDEEESEP
jgi:hypothetical protein